MLFNFILNQYLFLALARQQAALLIEGWCQLPTIPPAGQWANFLRNHDELDDQACMVTLDLSDYSITCLLDLLGDRQYQPLEKETYRVELAGYGYRWFRLRGNPD